jgi:hypothetical protein
MIYCAATGPQYQYQVYMKLCLAKCAIYATSTALGGGGGGGICTSTAAATRALVLLERRFHTDTVGAAVPGEPLTGLHRNHCPSSPF